MALRDINLITDDILEQRYLRRHLFIWCGCLLAMVVITAAVCGYATRIHFAAAKDPENGGNLTAALTAMVGEINGKQAKLNIALREWAQFSDLIARQRPYSSIIAGLAGTMNDQTWLQQLTLDPGRDRVARLKLLGTSLSQDHLGGFIQRLSHNPLFREVVLKYSQTSEVQAYGESPVQFQIECEISGG